MDKYSLRHLMAAVLVAEELRVPSIRSGDRHLIDELLRKQFTPMLMNTYFIVDLMFEYGDAKEAAKAELEFAEMPDLGGDFADMMAEMPEVTEIPPSRDSSLKPGGKSVIPKYQGPDLIE